MTERRGRGNKSDFLQSNSYEVEDMDDKVHGKQGYWVSAYFLFYNLSGCISFSMWNDVLEIVPEKESAEEE